MDFGKFVLSPLATRLAAAGVRRETVDEWMRSWKFFFILGFGRSGTAFMAALLDQVEGASVFHEPVLEDFYAHARAHYDIGAAEQYLQGFRRKEIYLRMRGLPSGIYGETNGHLRCHAGAIPKTFPGAVLLHLVRDGRDVVRSHMSRRTMTWRNPFSMSMHPVKPDPWFEQWAGMDRFARICWYWREENVRLRQTIGRTVRFEQILVSYEYFRANVLEPCGLKLDESAWRAAVAVPRNTTRTFQMPKWEDWSARQQDAFTKICGEEMLNCGYAL